jgi:hypothetical protein
MFYFSDLHVQLLARGILNPGEQLVGRTSTFYMPWWALGFINRRHLVLATDQRLIVVEHRWGFFPVGYRVHVVHSVPWGNLQTMKLKGIFAKKLVVEGNGDNGPVSIKASVPNTLFGLLAPMKNNLQGARTIEAHYKNGAALGAPQLQAFGQPIPAFNAPGYASVPPPASVPQPGAYGQVAVSYAPPNAPRS